MPLVDMPLEKLRVYQGTNPRPDDFDAFWDRGLDDRVRVIGSGNQKVCPDLSFSVGLSADLGNGLVQGCL